jgi:hypothetical protein
MPVVPKAIAATAHATYKSLFISSPSHIRGGTQQTAFLHGAMRGWRDEGDQACAVRTS